MIASINYPTAPLEPLIYNVPNLDPSKETESTYYENHTTKVKIQIIIEKWATTLRMQSNYKSSPAFTIKHGKSISINLKGCSQAQLNDIAQKFRECAKVDRDNAKALEKFAIDLENVPFRIQNLQASIEHKKTEVNSLGDQQNSLQKKEKQKAEKCSASYEQEHKRAADLADLHKQLRALNDSIFDEENELEFFIEKPRPL